jgi:hypothetical protein
MLVDIPWSSPSLLCPDPGRETWKEKEETARTPSLLALCSLHVADRRGLANAYPQCPDAETTPRQHAPKAAAPGFARACRQTPRTGHLLAILAPGLLAYKNPLRARS